MKITKTAFTRPAGLNHSSSFTIYVTKTHEDAQAIASVAMTQRETLTAIKGWYYSCSTMQVQKHCLVPEFFHDRDYYLTVIEHNNGDWKAPSKYELYIVD